ncbi:MAG: ROK family protein [Lactobacillus sp.]|jgi:predicted NBD/HSP70 family sugar kinase|nr:ROK family protein [Lactobacillus sp.]
MKQKHLAIDIGGTNLKYGLFDLKGNLIQKHTQPTASLSLEDFVKQVRQLVDTFKAEIAGIGFSVPGTVDNHGVIHKGGSLPFLDGLDFAQTIRVDLPIVVENDGKAAALAEAWQGNLAQVPAGVALILGTAVGGGIILNQQLFQGSHQQAGEFSFMAGQSKNMPQEDIAGNYGSAVEMIAQIAKRLGLTNDGKVVFDAIEAGNPIAKKIFDNYCYDIATIINNIQCVLDVPRFVIGGGISARASVTENINQQYDQLVAHNPAIGIALQKPEIMSSKFHNDANLYGAIFQLQQFHR